MANKAKHPGGRPRKYDGPSRPVTVTLPERTLELLQGLDADRGKAIVKAVDETAHNAWPSTDRVRLVNVGVNSSVIVVGQSQALQRIPWLKLVEIAPMRFLLAIPTGTPSERLELAILDLIAELPPDDHAERSLLGSLHAVIGNMRRQNRMTKFEIILVGV